MLVCTAKLISDPYYQQAFDDVYESLNLSKKLFTPQKGQTASQSDSTTSTKLSSWHQKYQNHSIDRNDAIKVIRNFKKLVTVYENQYKAKAGRSSIVPVDLYNLWDSYMKFVAIMSLDRVDISMEAEWNSMTTNWLLDFIRIFGQTEVTTYIHMFQAHSFDSMKHCSSMQKVSTFALESKHMITRRIYHDRTNMKTKTALNVLRDELLMEQYSFTLPNEHKSTLWFLDVIRQPDANFIRFIHPNDRHLY
jgi:hypothetical protein